ncbi:Hypothetical predicted protein, partial [Olea europaea subsp. europaea]
IASTYHKPPPDLHGRAIPTSTRSAELTISDDEDESLLTDDVDGDWRGESTT